MSDHPYLGTDLSPEDYYQQRASEYVNPFATAVEKLLSTSRGHLWGTILDLGCGDGLVTKILKPWGYACVGIDRSEPMVERYKAETGQPGMVRTFADVLPAADTAVASFSLHLAKPAELAMLWWRLADIGVKVLIVITPHKEKPPSPSFYFREVARDFVEADGDGKRVYKRVHVA